MKKLSIVSLALFLALPVAAQKAAAPLAVKDGKVVYTADERGNRVLDFSACGYRQQRAELPHVPAKAAVKAASGDMSATIQRAIDYVSALKPDRATGFRGAVVLGEGTFELSEPLRIAASGVVLRGAGAGKTVLRKTGFDRGAVVYVEGKNDCRVTDTLRIVDSYVPVNSTTLTLEGSVALAKGTRLIVVRPSTKEWIASIGCDVFGGGLGYWGWKPGEMDIRWQRDVTDVRMKEGKDVSNTQTSPRQSTLTSSNPCIFTCSLDAPLTAALDARWGGGYALVYSWPGCIHDSGVELLTIESEAASCTDENHAWDGVYVDAAEDCWVRRVDFRGLAGSAVVVQRYGQQVTVQDCRSYAPCSELGGWRRRTFLTYGGKVLFQRCYSEEGINDFAAAYCAPGPNAFVQCDAVRSHGMSGSVSSWATGLLFDNVNIEGGSLSFRNLGLDKWGAGWNTANSVMYQCSASALDCFNASADARCYAFACWGYCQGDGFWAETNNAVTTPRSLFMAQLAGRIGDEQATRRCRQIMRNLDGSSSPTIERAAAMAEEALKPRMTLDKWIEQEDESILALKDDDTKMSGDWGRRSPDLRSFSLETASNSMSRRSGDLRPQSGEQSRRSGDLRPQSPSISDGRIISDGKLMTGWLHHTPWWNGRTRWSYMDKADYAVTRFVPGTEQRGGTDRMDSVVANLAAQHVCVWRQNHGLWYDRRRDDHERIRRPDGDVWPPFFEQTIARSGKGQAWDGLSQYDLAGLNTWYFHRLRTLAERLPGLMVINNSFFQHNILEAGAHWVDCPWRSANNLQSSGDNAGRGTQFLEPVPFTGDKRIFTADLFYDVTNRERASLYRAYIYNVLDATASEPNIYQALSYEYTGPQTFVEFWLDCIASWQKERGKKARVVLNATKDVTEAVMAQEKYAALVDVIEIEQWYYHGGKLFAPEGGKNLAPRQHLRLSRTGAPTFADIYRTVSETRALFPTKPVLYYAKAYDHEPWAVLMAGGSCPTLLVKDARLAAALAQMKPAAAYKGEEGIYRMAGPGGTLLLNKSGKAMAVGKIKGASIVKQSDGTLSPFKATELRDGEMLFEPGR